MLRVGPFYSGWYCHSSADCQGNGTLCGDHEDDVDDELVCTLRAPPTPVTNPTPSAVPDLNPASTDALAPPPIRTPILDSNPPDADQVPTATEHAPALTPAAAPTPAPTPTPTLTPGPGSTSFSGSNQPSGASADNGESSRVAPSAPSASGAVLKSLETLALATSCIVVAVLQC